MPNIPPSDEAPLRTRTVAEIWSSFGLSYLLAIGLLAALVYQGGVWNVLANTRALDFFIEAGVIQYTDANQGIVEGVDSHESYLRSQDPIDYRLVLLAVMVYFLYFGLKAVQFHGIARFVGMKGSAGKHVKAWLYGVDGLGRYLPFRFGEAATLSALEAQGEDPIKARQALSVMESLVVVFEILAFWFFGLWITNYSLWFSQSMWALVICLGAMAFLRKTGMFGWGPEGFWRTQVKVYRALAERPAAFLKLGLLSMFCMLLDDLTPFLIAMGFTSDHVILNVSFIVVQSGVVAGYIAKRFPITPHGIGQFEWAFAAALYLSGLGFPEAATIALLDCFIRHAVGTIVFLIVTVVYGVETSFPRVFLRYVGAPAAPAAALVGGAASAADRGGPQADADAPRENPA